MTHMDVLAEEILQRLNEGTREFCYSKIHRCVVTQAELNYVGSITIDSALLRASGILPYSKVEVVNITRKDAARIVTYAIEGTEDSGVICLNGAAAHHFNRGDLAIIMAYEQVPASLIPHRQHTVVQVNGEDGISENNTNKITCVQTHTTPSLEDLGKPENDRYGQTYSTSEPLSAQNRIIKLRK